MEKRLYKSDTEKMICGVCGGLAEYLDFDPTLVRIVVFIIACMMGSGLFVYFIMAIIIPNRPEGEIVEVVEGEFKDENNKEDF